MKIFVIILLFVFHVKCDDKNIFGGLKSEYEFREDIEKGSELFKFSLKIPVSKVYVREPSYGFTIVQMDTSNQFTFILNNKLDYSIKASYDIFIIAEEKSETFHKQIKIKVLQVNKYRPYFLQYNDTLNLEEEKVHDIVLSIYAKDDDKKDYLKSHIENRGELDNKFALVQNLSYSDNKPFIEIKLKNIDKLDYESKTSYRIEIIIKDNQNEKSENKLLGKVFTDRAIIYINVIDIDDQNPTFIKDCGVQKIKEHFTGTVATVLAIDGDRDVNNPIQYSIVEKSPYFGINKIGENGNLFVKAEIDRESDDIINNPILTVNIAAKEYYENGTAVANRTTISMCTIIIIDVNDNAPKFNEEHYEASVKENTQIGIPITLNSSLSKVSDIDEGDNAKFELYLEDHQEIFAITPTHGINDVIFVIRVNNSNELDYEREDLSEPKQFNFKIIAKETETDQRFSSIANVIVNLEDVNDNFPQFSNLDEAYVYENASKEEFVALINATDIDSGYYGTKGIRYRLIPNYISDSFQINSITGNLTVAKTKHGFDYEKVKDYYLTIEAKDENGTGNGNTTQLHILIRDVNDNPPVFNYKSYNAHLMENSEKFADLLQLQASDADEPNTNNSIVRYDIIDSNFKNKFQIDPVEGIITPVSPLDFEDDEPSVNDNCITICTKTYLLNVMAYDLGIPRLSSTVSVYITLMDENDNVPEFNATTCNNKANINETSVGGTDVAQVFATDRDKSPMYSNISYTVIDGTKNNFFIDRISGNVIVAYNAYLNITDDRTKLSYQLKIEAADAMMKKQDDHFCTVDINVKDINDISPKFKYVATTGYRILENVNNKKIGLFEAIDPDETKKLKYSILFNKSEVLKPDMISKVYKDDYDYTKIFNINKKGEVSVVNPADREEMKSIDLTIKVVDTNGEINLPQEDEMRFRIIIEDENDNDPYFVNNNTLEGYINKVFENTEDIMLFTIQAKDIDENNTIIYSLDKNNDATDYFQLNTESGELRIIKPADYEEINWLNFSIFATDNGVPPRNASALVTIEILDENDNIPQFIGEPYTAEIKEHEPIGTFVIKINATDEDSGNKGLVHFRLSDLNSDDHHFEMENEIGKVTVLKDLDREIQEIYVISVQAYDSPYDRIDQNVNHTQVKITLIDINDNKPEIKPNDRCWRIPETHHINEDIGVISATDKDKEGTPNSEIEFFIIDSEYFDITLNGTLFVKSSLENLHKEFSVEVMAKDKGEPPLNSTQKFCVFVYDMNTHKPEFMVPHLDEFPKKIYVPEDSDENPSIGRKIITIKATDKDNDKNTNGNVSYTIIQDDEIKNAHTGTFKINSDGIISVNEKLKKAEKSFYKIIVQACDNGKPQYCADINAIIHVYVTNEIDSRPKFEEREIHINFTEHSRVGEEKSTLPKAFFIDDDDNNNNISICYFIVGGDASLFRLDKNKRILTVAKELDREENPFHYIIVKAQTECSATPQEVNEFKINQPDLINVRIRVLDINDNAPEFIKPNFTGGVKAEDKRGKDILTVIATDKDEGENAIVTYHIISDIKITKGNELSGISHYFLLNETTGKLTLAFQPTPEMKGHFTFTIMAKDKDNLNDTAKVLIYLIRNDQQIKIVFRKNVNQFTQEDQIKFQMILQSATQYVFNIDNISGYSGDKKRYQGLTEVSIHLVNPKSNEVIEVKEALSIIDRHYSELTSLGVIEVDKHTEEKIVNKSFWKEQESHILIATIGTLIFCTLLLLIVYFIRISSYKRLLKAATAKAYNDVNDYDMKKDSTTIVPNTNLHAMQGSNPIWNQEEIVNQCFSNETESDNGSQNSLDINEVEPIESNISLYNNDGKINPLFKPDEENYCNNQQMENLNIYDDEFEKNENTNKLNKMDLLKAVNNDWRRRNSKNDFDTKITSAPSFQDVNLY